jgi:hypothetical protein
VDSERPGKLASVERRFSLHRNNFIAHLASTEPSPDNIVAEKEIYAVVPKTIHLVELVHAELHPYSMHLGNIFTSTARDVASFFHHISADPLLARLFEQRALPVEEYERAVATFLNEYVAREKAARDRPRRYYIRTGPQR